MGFRRGKYLGVVLCFSILGCQKAAVDEDLSAQLITPGASVNRTIGDEAQAFQVVDGATVEGQLASGAVLSPVSAEGQKALAKISGKFPGLGLRASAPVAPAPTLVLGFPIGLLGENYVFGGVITKVSDSKSELLGGLKLSDLPPLHVRPVVADNGAGNYIFALLGCSEECGEGADEEVLMALPVLALDPAKSTVMIDIAPLGNALNLVQMMDPKGGYTKLKTKTNLTKAFDYSYSTLVFDVETTMEPVVATVTPVADTVFTVRWFLRLASTFDPAFTARPEANGVGYFMTQRGKQSVIQRFRLPRKVAGNDAGMIRYFIKGVPTEHRAAFQSAFDEWNGHFFALLGKKMLTYEFVEKTDPRFALLVPGDVRYNILEWDEDNIAGYGGLGPSIANQHTGEILSANVLIQGPKIIELYTQWFKVKAQVAALRAQGDEVAALELLRATNTRLARQASSLNGAKQSLRLGTLAFRIPSQEPGYSDPLFQRDDFEELPSGFTFETYMTGYFHDMVAHELGHNLGLRHNFRGNLGAAVVSSTGAVSRSIMEYLNRGFRHLNHVGPYDVMAIAYGYAGKKPTQTDLYCTDEDVADADGPKLSAECSRDDATPDPFGWFTKRLDLSLDRLVNAGSADAPAWTVADMERELGIAVTGMGLYASSAATTAGTWTNFAQGTRPVSAPLVKAFILDEFQDRLCGADLDAAVALKTDATAKQKTVDNIQAVRAKAESILTQLGAFTSAEVACP